MTPREAARARWIAGLRAIEDDLRASALEALTSGASEAEWLAYMVSMDEVFAPEALRALSLIAQGVWRGDVC
jgi:hypothetical protein